MVLLVLLVNISVGVRAMEAVWTRRKWGENFHLGLEFRVWDKLRLLILSVSGSTLG